MVPWHILAVGFKKETEKGRRMWKREGEKEGRKNKSNGRENGRREGRRIEGKKKE